jgi:undecaprenyl-diphosphatase
MDTVNTAKYNFVYDYETDRQKKIIALIIFLSSLLVFAFSVVGLLDYFSIHTSELLKNLLGYTNKWSTSYGPDWFVGLNKDVSALGGVPLLPIFFTIAIIYYHLRRESRRLWRLVFIVLAGAFLMLMTKLIFSDGIDNSPFEIIIGSISSFPSGHAMMGTIFYGTLAVTISRRQHSRKTKRLTLITGIVLIILIGISRVLPGTHTLNEVIAGWSLGLIWLCFCWFLERYIKKGRDLQKRSQHIPQIKT